jgi:hypothetical protein
MKFAQADRLRKMKKHACSSCDLSDEEWAYREGWNAAIEGVIAAERAWLFQYCDDVLCQKKGTHLREECQP